MQHFDTHLMLEYHRQRAHEAMADAQNSRMTRRATPQPIRFGFWVIAILCLFVLLTSACNVTVTLPDLTPVVVDVQVKESPQGPRTDSTPTLARVWAEEDPLRL
jgi:hypothetical protein